WGVGGVWCGVGVFGCVGGGVVWLCVFLGVVCFGFLVFWVGVVGVFVGVFGGFVVVLVLCCVGCFCRVVVVSRFLAVFFLLECDSSVILVVSVHLCFL
ncbi:hypothetical protein DVA80_20740, partial [Acinetobacter baumannii]